MPGHAVLGTCAAPLTPLGAWCGHTRSYSGPTAAYAYAHVPTAAGISRVFILGPSHHVHLSECALSEATQCATPLGTLPVDTAVVAELSKTVGWAPCRARPGPPQSN